MRIAVVYNRDSQSVINLFGIPNREKIGMKTIRRLTDALRKGGHEVVALEGDKDLIDRLEDFMPRVVHGERPGMVFNVSYGLQGQARYTHIPSILEMVGIPYVASGPLGHSLALDKVVTKMILRQNDVPTPDFAVLQTPDMPLPPDLRYPMIVKPKNEAVSFGLKVVQNEDELREAARVIFDEFHQAVLAEQFIEGREVNVGLLGNNPPEAFPPVELVFGEGAPSIYTYEDKTGRSGRTISYACPAPIGEALTAKAVEVARKSFECLGIYDCARVDMRLDREGRLYVLEVNSLPSLGEHGSYLVGAAHVGLDFAAFVNRLVEVACARYFGTPSPPLLDKKSADPRSHVLSYITQRRAQIERDLREWVELSSRTGDPIGIQQATRKVGQIFDSMNLKRVPELSDDPEVFTWETARGLEGGLLLVAHADVPMDQRTPHQPFRREPEWLYGEGIGTSRAPLVMLEYVLRSLRSIRRLRRLPLGICLYTDEGRGAQVSREKIQAAAARAKRVIVLRPGTRGDGVIVRRRGNRKFRLRVVGEGPFPGRGVQDRATLRWTCQKLEALSLLNSAKDRVSLSTLDMRTERHPMRLPHRVTAHLLMTYPDPSVADLVEARMRSILGRGGPKWELAVESDRPPMRERPINNRFLKTIAEIAVDQKVVLKKDTSSWASVAGLVPPKVACLCGVSPVARDRGTPQESIQRISLIQRTLILAELLATELEDRVS